VASGDDLRERVGPELRRTVWRGDVLDAVAVVRPPVAVEVVQAVHVRPHL
jgi:hypothetical protein